MYIQRLTKADTVRERIQFQSDLVYTFQGTRKRIEFQSDLVTASFMQFVHFQGTTTKAAQLEKELI